MSFPIGFAVPKMDEEQLAQIIADSIADSFLPAAKPKPSVVRVHFAQRGMTLAYYNEKFDLRPGDLVYVEGKLAGIQGRVETVTYNFKIKRADFKQVIQRVDTTIHGKLYLLENDFVDFGATVLPPQKICSWFFPPMQAEEYVCGSDDSCFWLDELEELDIEDDVIEEGLDCWREKRVVYLCVDGANSCAIVQGSKPYLVEFCCEGDKISRMTCPCFYGGNCKHIVAVLAQLKRTVELLDERWPSNMQGEQRFAVIDRNVLLAYSSAGEKGGELIL